MGDEQQEQREQAPKKRTLSFPVRRRDEQGTWVPTGGMFELEVWEPEPGQISSVVAGITDALSDQSGKATFVALGDLVAALVLAQAVDGTRGEQLRNLLWNGQVSTIQAAEIVSSDLIPAMAEGANREDRRAALKATRKPQQQHRGGGGGHGRRK